MKTFLLSALFIILFNSAFSQWVQTNGPAGGNAEAFATDSAGYVFAAGEFGIYRSEDNGNSWQERSEGLVAGWTHDMVVAPDGVLFATDSGVARSYDSGGLWELCNNGITNLNIRSLAITGTGRVFAAAQSWLVDEAGLFYSDNNGDSWTHLFMGSPWYDNVFVEAAPNGTLFFGGSSAVAQTLQRSLDNGETWEEVTLGYSYNIMNDLYMDGLGNVYVAIGGDTPFRVLRSADNGQSWQSLLEVSAFEILVTSGQDIFIATNANELYRSADNGSTWDVIELPHYNAFRAMMEVSADTLLAGSLIGIFRSHDHGETWQWSTEGINTATIHSMAISDSILLATTQDFLWKTTDDGNTWLNITDSLQGPLTSPMAYGGGYFWVLCYPDLMTPTLFRSTGSGPWQTIPAPAPTMHDLVVSPQGSIYYASDSLYRSSDDGATWETMDTGEGNEDFSRVLVTREGSILAANNNAYVTVYRSTDDGETWMGVMPDPADYSYTRGLVSDSAGNIYLCTDYFLYRSDDDGITWTELAGLPTSYDHIAIFTDQENNVYLAELENLYVSSDEGENWALYDQGIEEATCFDGVASGNGLVFVGLNNGGVWKRGIEVATHDTPASSRTFTILPNPASGTAFIHYPRFNSSKETMYSIFTVDGKLLETKTLTSVTTTLNLNTLLSGSYILQIGDVAQVIVVSGE